MKLVYIILIAILIILWLSLGVWAFITAIKTFKKYKNYKPIENLDIKYKALVREDFNKWNHKRILIGCFTLFPLRILLFITLVFGCIIFAILIKIFGYKPLINNLFTIYLNTYGKLICRCLCSVYEHFDDKQIYTPIIISNHVTWFDPFYITLGNAPVSFLSKAEVENWPIIGIIAKARQCVFVERDKQQARVQAKHQIKQRIQQYKKQRQNTFPLVIFPQGTTSNGKGLLSFKNGAFENMSQITAFCLKYQCKYFDMGLDQLEQSQHAVFMMSQFSKLIVQKMVFKPKHNENSLQYQNRCRNQMAEALGIFITEGGFRDRQFITDIRNKNIYEMTQITLKTPILNDG